MKAFAISVLALAALPYMASAQFASFRVNVRGTDSVGVAGARARFPELGLDLVADTAGQIAVRRAPQGRWTLQLRGVGFSPVDTVLDVGPSAAAFDFVMRRMVQALDTTNVIATRSDAIPTSATLPEFEARRARATGRFLTRDQLRKEDERGFPDVLRAHMPGMLLEVAFDGVHAYNPSQQPPGALRGNQGRKCYVQIVVDGSSIYQMGQSKRQDEERPPPDLSGFLTNSLDGVEYYSGPSRTPPELRGPGAVCGTLVLWSRRR